MGCHHKNNVAGASNKGYDCNNVSDVSDANFKVPVYSYINGKDFCRAVNRCLKLNEAENENNGHGCHCGCKRRRKY